MKKENGVAEWSTPKNAFVKNVPLVVVKQFFADSHRKCLQQSSKKCFLNNPKIFHDSDQVFILMMVVKKNISDGRPKVVLGN